MRLTVLGSGNAFDGAGHNAAYVLESRLLVDCGAPVHVLAPHSGIAVTGLRTLLLTHFHFDHVSQVPLLFGALALGQESAGPLTVAGPAGTTEYLRRLLRTGYGSTLERIVRERLTLETVVLQDGSDCTIDGMRVRAASVVHSTGPSLAYAVTGEDGVTVGFSGDSTDCVGLRRVIAMSDVMVCECTGWDGPVPSHLWAGEVRALMAAHPTTRFLLSHLAERRAMAGALVAHDGLTLDVLPRDRPPAEIPATLVRASADVSRD